MGEHPASGDILYECRLCGDQFSPCGGTPFDRVVRDVANSIDGCASSVSRERLHYCADGGVGVGVIVGVRKFVHERPPFQLRPTPTDRPGGAR